MVKLDKPVEVIKNTKPKKSYLRRSLNVLMRILKIWFIFKDLLFEQIKDLLN